MRKEAPTGLQLTDYSTKQVEPGNEVDYWRYARRKAYVATRTDPLQEHFSGVINLGEYPNFRLSTKHANAETVLRSASDIAQSPEDQEYLYFVFQQHGNLLVEQNGREVLAKPGTLVIYDSAKPFRLQSKTCYKQVVLEMPADDAFAHSEIKRSEDIFARTFACIGAVKPIADFFTSLAKIQQFDPQGAHQLNEQASALGSSLIRVLTFPYESAQVSTSIRRYEALEFIQAHFTDPRLTTDQIAANLHISKRSLFRTFENSGETVREILQTLRLERSRLLLQSFPHKPIEIIANESGFSSPLQLYRAFRSSYHITPSEYREKGDTTE